MTNYSKTTNFTAKDSLVSGDANKIVKGSEIDAEFDNIATASATKANIASPTFTGVVSFPDGTAGDPSITNVGDTNTGLFFSAADTLAFSSAGTAQFTMSDGAIAPVTDNDVDLGTSSLEFKDGYFDGTVHTDAINLNGTAITSTAAEINILDGVTSTAAELNILDGVTSTAAELNILDGVTSTASELNILDGVTSTTAELNILDGVTATTAELNIMDGVTATTAELNIMDGVTSTASELNILDGVTSTAAELNILDGVTATTAELNYSDTGSSVGTVVASKVVTVDANKDVSSFRNITLTGELDAGSLDISGDADIDGTLETDALSINGTAVTSTAAELNILDGVTSTAAELNILDGVTSTAAELNILDGKAFLDEDDMSSNSATGIASQQSIKAYVDTQITAEDLDITTDSGTIDIDLDGDTLTISGGEGIDTSATGTTVTITAEEATTSNKGVASFDTNDFSVSSGAVSLATTSTAAELNILDGATVTTAELNILDGVTSTAAELNILDGVTASAADINLIDGITNGTVIASKAIITDSNKDITGGRNITISGELDAATLDISGDADIDGTLETDALSINGTAVTSTAAELNILDGVTSTAAELNTLDGITAVVGELNALDLGSTAVGTAIASKAVILDSNKDYTGIRNFTISGELDAGSLDISGDIDVDGTTNLDVVDIDGAVDMATTLQVTGNLTTSGNNTFTVTNNTSPLTLVSTDADANSGPFLDFWRNSSSPADADPIGQIRFYGENDNDEAIVYSAIDTRIVDASDGTEDGRFEIATILAGTAGVSRILMDATETAFNDNTKDLDFRVESNNKSSMFLVDGGTDTVIIGGGVSENFVGESHELQVNDTNFSVASFATYRNGSDGATLSVGHSRNGTINSHTVLNSGDIMGQLAFFGSDGTDFARGASITAAVDGTPGNNDMPGRLVFSVTADGSDSPTERWRINNSGVLVSGGQTPVGQAGDPADANFTELGAGYLNLAKDDTAAAAQILFAKNGTSVSSIQTSTNGLILQVTDGHGSVVVNDAGNANTDFRVEGDSNANMLFVDASSDRVGVGTSSPAAALDVVETATATVPLRVETAGGSANTVRPQISMFSGSSNGYHISTIRSNASNDPYGFVLTENTTERLRIDNNGNLGLGATPISLDGNATPGLTIASNGPFICLQDANNADKVNYIANNSGVLQFGIVGDDGAAGKIEVAQFLSSGAVFNENHLAALDFRVESDTNSNMFHIDSSINCVGVGRAASSQVLMYVDAPATHHAIVARNATAGFASIVFDNTDGSGQRYFASFRINNSEVGKITSTGSATDYGTSSDVRLKNNIQDADDAGSKIDAIQVRQFDWKLDGKHQDYGMIAQELQSVAPNAVQTPEDPDEMMGVDYSKLVPMLVKEIQSLRNRVAELEGE